MKNTVIKGNLYRWFTLDHRCDVLIQSRSTGLVDIQTWVKDKHAFADGIGYTGQDEHLLKEASSGGSEENLDYIVGDPSKLLCIKSYSYMEQPSRKILKWRQKNFCASESIRYSV